MCRSWSHRNASPLDPPLVSLSRVFAFIVGLKLGISLLYKYAEVGLLRSVARLFVAISFGRIRNFGSPTPPKRVSPQQPYNCRNPKKFHLVVHVIYLGFDPAYRQNRYPFCCPLYPEFHSAHPTYVRPTTVAQSRDNVIDSKLNN